MPDPIALDLDRAIAALVSAAEGVRTAARRYAEHGAALALQLQRALGTLSDGAGTEAGAKVRATSGHGKRRRGLPSTRPPSAATITWKHKTLSPMQWEERLQIPGLSRMLIISRIRRGWSAQRALTEPPMPSRGKLKPAKKTKPTAPSKSRSDGRGNGARLPAPRTTGAAHGKSLLKTISQIAMMHVRVNEGEGVPGTTDEDKRMVAERAKGVPKSTLDLARRVNKYAPDLVPDVLRGKFALSAAYAEVLKRRSTPTPTAEKPATDLSPDDVVDRGERCTFAQLAARRGDSSAAPLLEQLKHMSLAEAMAQAPQHAAH